MARRSRRRRTPIATYAVVVIAAFIICSVVYIVISSNVHSTAVIEIGDMGNQYKAEAVIVRNENVTDVEGLTSVKYSANEGQITLKGDRIAEVYAAGYSQTDVNRLLNIRAEIKSSVKTILSAEYSDARLETHDKQILMDAQEISALLHGTETGNLLNLQRQLTTSLTDRQAYIKEQYYSKYPLLAELYDSETSQIKKIQSWTNIYLATRDCIVSFYTDGYESMLDVEAFDQITLEDVRKVLNGEEPPMTSAQRGRTAVFREVDPSGWYLLLLSRDASWNPIDGQTYKVHLEGFDNNIVSAVVSTSARVGTELLVRMRVDGDVTPILNTRTTNAQVGEMNVSGLKVPSNALLQQNNQVGIVLNDGEGIFVPVEIIDNYNDYAIIRSLDPSALSEGQIIRTF